MSTAAVPYEKAGRMCAELGKASTYQLRTRQDRGRAHRGHRGGDQHHYRWTQHTIRRLNRGAALSADDTRHQVGESLLVPAHIGPHPLVASHAYVLALSSKTRHHPHRRAALPPSRASPCEAGDARIVPGNRSPRLLQPPPLARIGEGACRALNAGPGASWACRHAGSWPWLARLAPPS